MEDYEFTIGTIEYYKSKACECIKGKCDKCEAMYEYGGKQYCQFDTVIRFIKWNNQYNT
jgi:hypothetical protein